MADPSISSIIYWIGSARRGAKRYRAVFKDKVALLWLSPCYLAEYKLSSVDKVMVKGQCII